MSTAQFIGISPAGVEWVAYKPEHVATMTARLAVLHARHAAKAARSTSLADLRARLRTKVGGVPGRLVYRSRYEGSVQAIERLVRVLGGTVHERGKRGKVRYLPSHETTLPHFIVFSLGSDADAALLRSKKDVS